MSTGPARLVDPPSEVASPVELLRRLLRYDTSNPPGDEGACIAYVESLLHSAGLQTRLIESAPGRPNLVARLAGRGVAPPLLLQGHVDVVPATEPGWTKPPFAGEIHDGCVYGRGALDMKGGVSMIVSALLRAAAQGAAPPGDVIVAILVDEETGSRHGADFLVEHHAELFEGVRYALGEFGGFSLELGGGRRVYPVQVAEKQVCWVTATIRTGSGGHGALARGDGAVARVASTLRRIERRRLPVRITPVARAMVEGIAAEMPFVKSTLIRRLLTPRLTDRVLDLTGASTASFDAMLHNTVTVTGLRGGTGANVVPSEIAIDLDGRLVPGCRPDDLFDELRGLLGDDIELELRRYDGGSQRVDLGLLRMLGAVIGEQDPGRRAVPMLMPASSDGRFFARLGIQPYGFLPMRLPESLAFSALIHAADERIPVDAVEFGTSALRRVLDRFDDVDEARVSAIA